MPNSRNDDQRTDMNTANPSKMRQIHCNGTSFEIGHSHGHQAADLIALSIKFYAAYFKLKANLSWGDTRKVAASFTPYLAVKAPALLEEMKGIAAGAGVSFEDILALNVRSEIACGMLREGCTSLWCAGGQAGTDAGGGVLAQNWDWEPEQQQCLVVLHIKASADGRRPALCAVTEAGIVGKIGFNAQGVGVCLNAIRARGVGFGRLPVHVSLRLAMEASSREEAVRLLLGEGVATSVHIVVADELGATGMEFSHADAVVVGEEARVGGDYCHSNNWLMRHAESDGKEIRETTFAVDAPTRMQRARTLLGERQRGSDGVSGEVADTVVTRILEDEEGFPNSINKLRSPESPLQTLFSVVMDLRSRTARVRVGRPTKEAETLSLSVAS